jgi:hypothetical protein
MSNIVKGVVMNNKYLLLYKEYMLNNIYNLAKTRQNVCRAASGGCCDDCNGSCITRNAKGSGGSGKYRLVKEFNKSKVNSLLLCSKLCSDNIHNDCICL